MAEMIPIAGGVKLAKDVVKEFSQGFKDLKDFGEGGARQVKDAFDSVTTAIGVLDPLLIPMKLLFAEIGAETVQSSMKFSAELVELLKQPSTQLAIHAFIGGINLLLEGLTNAAKSLNRLDETFAKIGKIGENLSTSFENIEQRIGATIIRIKSAITQPFEDLEVQFTQIMERVTNSITAPFEALEAKMTAIKARLDAIVSRINPFD